MSVIRFRTSWSICAFFFLLSFGFSENFLHAQQTISGSITPASVSAGATVTLQTKVQGRTVATTAVASNGNYAFSGIAKGSYRVVPSGSGLSFSPASTVVRVTSSNIGGINFTIASTTTTTSWSISGSISGGAGAAVSLGGAGSAETTADANGNYSFSGLPNGNYTVTPSRFSYTFSPASLNVAVNGANVTGANFTATATSHSVSLNWNASTSSTVSGYYVYRSSNSGGPYALLNSAPNTTTVYSDLNVSSGATYYYVVSAVDSAGNQSSYSNQASAVIPNP